MDAIGLVFYASSPRCVSPQEAAAICRALDPLVTAVGLFVDADEAQVRSTLADCPLDVLQFHGGEDAAYCSQFARPYWKAVRMRPDVDVPGEVAAHAAARAFLLDSYRPGVPGGTGASFAWDRVPAMTRPWMLAGGLNAENVGAAIAQANPPAVDVSGGVESAPGEKDPEKIRHFVAAVRAADSGS